MSHVIHDVIFYPCVLVLIKYIIFHRFLWSFFPKTVQKWPGMPLLKLIKAPLTVLGAHTSLPCCRHHTFPWHLLVYNVNVNAISLTFYELCSLEYSACYFINRSSYNFIQFLFQCQNCFVLQHYISEKKLNFFFKCPR